MPEHTSLVGGQGLKYRQNEAIARQLSAFGHSQSAAEDILQRITAQPSLSSLFVKDRTVVITPYGQPPSLSVVQEWLDSKQKEAKAQKEEHLQQKCENEGKRLVKAPVAKAEIVVTCSPVVEKANNVTSVREASMYERNFLKQSLKLKRPEVNEIQGVSNTESTFHEKATQHVTRDSLLLDGKLSLVSLSGQTACIPKASCIELEIPNATKIDYELKEENGRGAESPVSEERSYEDKTVVEQTKRKDVPFSGEQLENVDDLPETIASTPVHQSEAVSKRMLKCFEDEGLLLCTPIQKIEELSDQARVAEASPQQKSSSDIINEANKSKDDGDRRTTPLSSRLMRLGQSSTTRRLLISQEPVR